MKRKHSYRENDRRIFNSYILTALKDPESLQDSINDRLPTSKHREKYIGMMTTAKQVAETIKREFKTLGDQINLSRYSPYVNEIKELLRGNSNQSTNQLNLF